MNPETEEQRFEREAAIKVAAEALGLVAHGSVVLAPLANPVAVDASAVDMNKFAACLMYLAHKAGVEEGREQVMEEIGAVLSAGRET